MQTIQVVPDAKLLKATDTAAKREKVNRSMLIRRALHEHLRQLRIREMEARERRGYEVIPQRPDEFQELEDESIWRED